MFDAADVVVVVLTARVSTRSVVGEVCFPRSEPTPAVKKPSAVVSPVPHIGSHCCPGISRPVPADDDLSSVSSGFIQPSSFSSMFTCTSDEISGLNGRGIQCCAVLTGVTVTCAASRLRLSTYRLITASSSSGSFLFSPSTSYIVFCQGLVLAGIEIASFNVFNSDHRLWVNS